MLGNRQLRVWLQALVEPQHYYALARMARVYPRFAENLWRYVSGRGSYPYDIALRTPCGEVSVRLYSFHDILTVNEIFCRNDYPAGADSRYVLDIGSNIGISALFFLTRNPHSRCILYEPDPRNLERLRRNLAGFEDRYTVLEQAVADRTGRVAFGTESSGRYGGIGIAASETIEVECVHIDDAVRRALQDFPHIDILKIDTEGVEVQTVEAIDPQLLPRIRRIYLEACPPRPLWPQVFRNRQYGSVRQLSLAAP